VRDADSGGWSRAGTAPHPATTPPRSEQDPNAWWKRAASAAIEAAGDSAREVAAVAVAGQQHGMVVVDADDQVIRPPSSGTTPSRAPDARWLIEQLGGEAAWAAACGSVPVAAFTITKLSWLHRREPIAWERIRACVACRTTGSPGSWRARS